MNDLSTSMRYIAIDYYKYVSSPHVMQKIHTLRLRSLQWMKPRLSISCIDTKTQNNLIRETSHLSGKIAITHAHCAKGFEFEFRLAKLRRRYKEKQNRIRNNKIQPKIPLATDKMIFLVLF